MLLDIVLRASLLSFLIRHIKNINKPTSTAIIYIQEIAASHYSWPESS